MQNQIDGSIMTWCYSVAPTSTNVPASNWTTTDLKNKHLGDLYYDTVTGYCYRWQVLNNTYSWQRITDTDVTKALEDASKAQDTADSKRRVFVSQPTCPYEIGGLWSGGSTGDLKRCKITRLTGTYVATDWELASKYTDDTKANTVANNLSTNYSTTTAMNSAITQAKNEINLNVSSTATSTLNSANSYTDTAKASAISTASTDATTKATQAKTDAIADTTTKLQSYSTTTQMNSAINVTTNNINLSVSKSISETNNGTVDTQTGTQVESTKSQDAYALCEIVGASYQNGTPTPTKPITIHKSCTYNSTTQKYDVKLTARKKNLVGTDTSIYYPVDMSSGSRVVTLTTKTGIAPAGESKLVFYKADKSQDSYFLFNSTNASTGKITITLPTTVCYLKWETINATDLPMVERGSVATLYEDYKGNTQTVSFATPLRKNDKLILATEDKTIGANTVKKGDFYVEKHRAIMTLGSGDTFAVEETNKYYCTNKVATGVKKSVSEIVVMSNYFKGISFNDRNANDNAIYGNSSDERIRIVSTSFADATSLNTWLSTHTITIEYELDTPTYEILDSVSQANLHKLATYSGYTNISTDSTVKPTLTARCMSSLYGNTVNNKSSLDIQDKKISAVVSSVDSEGSVVLTDNALDVIADNINLTGKVTFSSLDTSTQTKINDIESTSNNTSSTLNTLTTTENNVTVIDGGKILTNSIDSDKINVTDLFAQDIVATGSITGVILKSTNYTVDQYNKIISGCMFNLANGSFGSKNMSWDYYGNLNVNNATFNSGTFKGDLVQIKTINSTTYTKTIITDGYIKMTPYINGVANDFATMELKINTSTDTSPISTITLGTNATNISSTGIYTLDLTCDYFYSAGQSYFKDKTFFSGTSYPQIIGNGTYLQLSNKNKSNSGIVIEHTNLRPATNCGLDLGMNGVMWNNIFANTSSISTSDRNKKKDINDLDSENNKKFIMSLLAKSYKLKDGTSTRTHFGFVSQDVEDELSKLGISSQDFAGFIKSPHQVQVEYDVLDENGNVIYNEDGNKK